MSGQEQAKATCPGQRHRFFLAAGLMVLWLAFLLYQTLVTTNPVIVSRPGLLSTPIVVEGTLTTTDPAVIKVKRVCWPPESLVSSQDELRLSQLPSSLAAPSDVSRFFLLDATGEGSCCLWDGDPHGGVYPAEGGTRRQIEALLAYRAGQRGQEQANEQ